MGFSPKLLGQGEHVVIHTRTHWKALLTPALVFLVLCLVLGVSLGWLTPQVPEPYRIWAIIAIVCLIFAIFVVASVAPFLRWLSATYTVTDRRLITRRGVFNVRGHDLPLTRINDVTYERTFLERILGCGSLTLTTAAESPLTLHDIPHVEQVHLRMTELLFAHDHDPND